MRVRGQWWLVWLVITFACMLQGCGDRDTLEGWTVFPKSSELVFSYHRLGNTLGRTYGRKDMLAALEDAARHVQKKYPGTRIAYLDVSQPKGGRMLPHLSHRKGIDIDLVYFGTTPKGGLFPTKPTLFGISYFLRNYNCQGKCGKLTFDRARNWELLVGLRNNKHLRVEKIFVEPYIRDWLLEEGRRQGASDTMMNWAKNTLRYAGKNAAPHKDHFHIRFVQ